MFQGKTVALTGPAPHILREPQDLSRFDIVARVNMMVPMSEALIRATGNRCDVWYPSNQVLERHPELCALPEVKLIRTTSHGAQHIPQAYKHKWSRTGWNLTAIMNEIGCMPNRGLRAMIDILAHNPAELYITGFTFYQAGAYYDGYTSEETNAAHLISGGDMGGHKQKPQIDYFRRHIYKDPRVKLDSWLHVYMLSLDSM